MRHVCLAFLSLVSWTSAAANHCDAEYGAVRLHGPLAERMARMVSGCLVATDVDYLTAPFRSRTERSELWQTEFWGKYMHSAVPFCAMTGSAELREHVERGVKSILSCQEPCGYIGNYPDDLRCGEGWDVWGMKYTMLGLLHYADWTGNANALTACRRLCDYLIGELGPNGRRGKPLYATGYWSGMASSSVLEPVVWLHRLTGEKRYLEFAEFIVKGMTEPADGPRLVDLALDGIAPADRNGRGNPPNGPHGYVAKSDRRKAYEMMSCYQGLLEFYEVTGHGELLRATEATVEQVIRDEVNVAGGCSAGETWYHGAANQHLPFAHQQETCVLVTWMRLLGKLLSVTGKAKYADELERTFLNAYLASLNREGAEFAAYTPLDGSRFSGHRHCFMHTNCCNANGPRGFLSYLRAFIQSEGETAYLNFYTTATAETRLASDGGNVRLDLYSDYPKTGHVRIANRTEGTRSFTLALRVPGWCEKAVVKVNGNPVTETRSEDGYLRIPRVWRANDVIEAEFDLPVRVHRRDHHVAFTRGPIALARDSRMGDGPVGEPFRPNAFADGQVPEFHLVRGLRKGVAMTVSACLPIGQHDTNPEGKLPSEVRFCDFASAGNEWDPENEYRVWFPVQYRSFEAGISAR